MPGVKRLAPTALTLFITLITASGCATTTAPDAGGDPVLEEGRSIWTRSCASCHGAAGGGGRGPQLSAGKVVDAFSYDEELQIVADGRNGMPGFSGRLSGEELDAVVRYTREVLANS